LRLENDKVCSGDADVEFVRLRLLQEKKVLIESVEEAKMETRIWMDEMQVVVDVLQHANMELKKQVERATLEINEYDDEEIRLANEMVQTFAHLVTRNAAREKRASITVRLGINDLDSVLQVFPRWLIASISNVAS
jgi:hypothetical protein